MGTRAVTKVLNEDEEVILSMYSQFDGYPDGLGRSLIEFLKKIKMINGISFNEERKVANGMGCLAAQLVVEFKKEAGGYYLTTPDDEESYNYTIYSEGNYDDQILKIKVESYSEVLFDGKVEDYNF
tara:strand:- start:440 stop:817 length:378 start_codon:yes stop_codon:yes gene_type:complete